MKLLEKILLPVDVNKNNEEQIELAIKLSKEFNSEILVMYVLPDEDIHPEINSLLNNYISDTLKKVVELLRSNKISCGEPMILYGNPTDKILQAVNEQKANLILAGSGNKAKEEEFRLGTTAEKLISLSDVPVWIVGSNQKTSISKILCPVDFSDSSKRALKNAILIAKTFEANLTILSVFEPFIK